MLHRSPHESYKCSQKSYLSRLGKSNAVLRRMGAKNYGHGYMGAHAVFFWKPDLKRLHHSVRRASSRSCRPLFLALPSSTTSASHSLVLGLLFGSLGSSCFSSASSTWFATSSAFQNT